MPPLPFSFFSPRAERLGTPATCPKSASHGLKAPTSHVNLHPYCSMRAISLTSLAPVPDHDEPLDGRHLLESFPSFPCSLCWPSTSSTTSSTHVSPRHFGVGPSTLNLGLGAHALFSPLPSSSPSIALPSPLLGETPTTSWPRPRCPFTSHFLFFSYTELKELKSNHKSPSNPPPRLKPTLAPPPAPPLRPPGRESRPPSA